MARAGIDPAIVDTVNMGIVVSAGLGEAPAKAAALRAGLSPTIHSRAIDSVCGSALDALALGVESLLAGTAQVLVAGGMESRSNAPYLLADDVSQRRGHVLQGRVLEDEAVRRLSLPPGRECRGADEGRGTG